MHKPVFFGLDDQVIKKIERRNANANKPLPHLHWVHLSSELQQEDVDECRLVLEVSKDPPNESW